MQYRIAPPSLEAWQQQKDDSDLRTLSILHYVYAGLVGLASLLSVGYVVMGVFLAVSMRSSASADDRQAGAVVGGFFIAIGLVVFVLLIAKTVLLILSARAMSLRSRYTLAFVTACISCINIPFGTALGVFTIIVLSRPSVKAAFGVTR